MSYSKKKKRNKIQIKKIILLHNGYKVQNYYTET